MYDESDDKHWDMYYIVNAWLIIKSEFKILSFLALKIFYFYLNFEKLLNIF